MNDKVSRSSPELKSESLSYLNLKCHKVEVGCKSYLSCSKTDIRLEILNLCFRVNDFQLQIIFCIAQGS